MAKPKVFISSTCFDFREVRDSLSSFIRSFGFEPVLSEHGDVFYHPDLHTHEACVHEVGNCQLFVLLIGGRFGGSYIYDKSKSITNAEYEAAVKKNIPVFTYVKRNVLDNHHTYQTNKDKDFISEMHFPAIDEQSNAQQIFEFINRVRRAVVNNAYEPFETSRDIEGHLRKQIAGMFFDFLKSREVSEKLSDTNEAVSDIRSVSEKLEALIKNVYRVVDKDNAEKEITDIETNLMAKEYLQRSIGEYLDGKIYLDEGEGHNKILAVDPKNYNWWQYLVEIGMFEVTRSEDGKEDSVELWIPDRLKDHPGTKVGYIGLSIDKNSPHSYQQETEYLYENGFKLIDNDSRSNLLSKYLPSDSPNKRVN